ncbi:transcriptional repressor [Sulfurimonas sp. HSL-1656]|uniref:Fur family transcriptional regulator n=1 Tax=Thiomicrolovo subterrani TaxID=3131934 RepID=UPI0031F8A8E9
MNKELIATNLRNHHLKVTPQRLKIVESLNTFGHLNIDMLYQEVKEAYPNVSLATVYKNIAIMTENGLLEEVKVPESKSVFEIRKEPHLHLHCSECGKIEDFSFDTEQIRAHAETVSGYSIQSSDIVLRGVCPACQTNAKK